jgi:hypothetical protein
MELCGPPQRVVCGGSAIRGGSISGLSGTLRPDSLRRLAQVVSSFATAHLTGHFGSLGKASLLAHEHGVCAKGSIIEGREVRAILHFLKDERADLLVIGLHQHDFYLSRLWSSVYDSRPGNSLHRARCALSASKERRGISIEIDSGFGGFRA